jgi:hypothetical protein
MNTLPKLNKVRIPVEKFTQYALNPINDPDKSLAFDRALGYNLGNFEVLIQSILENLDKFPAIEKGDKGYGMTYEVAMELTGVNKKTASVLTAWIDDDKSDEMRLISAYINER